MLFAASSWLLTGDFGPSRRRWLLTSITDRKKDMLLVNGNNVYPREIEEVILQFPNVKEAAVVGQPDARRGEQPIAFVVPNEGTNIDESRVAGILREKLAD